MRAVLRIVVFLLVAGGLSLAPAPQAAHAQQWSELDISTAANGDVTVNGVVFEAALGVAAEDVPALVEAAKSSAQGMMHLSNDVQARLSAVLDAITPR